MRRFCTIFLILAFAQIVLCSLITERETKDILLQDAEVEENSVNVPVEGVAQPNAVAQNAGCAKIGDFCMNHKDCCSNSCLGYMKRCVSAREYEERIKMDEY